MARATATAHILIVDDEEAVCWALERGLTRDGFSVKTTASAEEAFILAMRRRPDVVVDVRLTGARWLGGRLAKLK